MARQELFGFGEGLRLIGFEDEEVIGPILLRQLPRIGFDRVGGIPRDADSG